MNKWKVKVTILKEYESAIICFLLAKASVVSTVLGQGIAVDR